MISVRDFQTSLSFLPPLSFLSLKSKFVVIICAFLLSTPNNSNDTDRRERERGEGETRNPFCLAARNFTAQRDPRWSV
jgi:hypothetical protein